MQKDVPPSHELQDHACEYQNHFELNKNNPSLRNCRINWVFQAYLIWRKGIMRVWLKESFTSNKIGTRPQILVKLSFKELCDAKLSGYIFLTIIAISLSKKLTYNQEGRLLVNATFILEVTFYNPLSELIYSKK